MPRPFGFLAQDDDHVEYKGIVGDFFMVGIDGGVSGSPEVAKVTQRGVVGEPHELDGLSNVLYNIDFLAVLNCLICGFFQLPFHLVDLVPDPLHLDRGPLDALVVEAVDRGVAQQVLEQDVILEKALEWDHDVVHEKKS